MMVAINFNAYQHEPSSFEPIPAAWYNVRVSNTDRKPTKTGGSYLEIEYTVVDGQYINRKLFDRLNLENSSEQAVSIANQTLTTILFCIGLPQITDSGQMHGAVLQARAIVEKTEAFGDQNRIKGYQNIHGQTATEIKKAMSEGAGAAPPQAPPPGTVGGQMQRPTDPAYIHNAGLPDEMWWNGTAWAPAPQAPPAPPAPPPAAAAPPPAQAAPPPAQQAAAAPTQAYNGGNGAAPPPAGAPPLSPTQQAMQGATPPWGQPG